MFDQIWTFFLSLFDYLSRIIQTLPRDIRGLYKLLRHSLIIKYHVYRKRDFIAIFRDNVRYYKSKPCFIFEETTLSFQEVCYLNEINNFLLFVFFKVEDLTNQLANYFLAEGYSYGDVIALILDNSIEYPCVWIALSKIGCITALINSNLRATPLLHSIRTVNAKGIITSKHLLPGKSLSYSFLV
jgi:acyl-CoA synthetase (AMP-forming)/AMP-acid ligase II